MVNTESFFVVFTDLAVALYDNEIRMDAPAEPVKDDIRRTRFRWRLIRPCDEALRADGKNR